MKIAVCMKQVPAYSEGNMDEKTGVLIRAGLESIVNPYDLSALESALRMKDTIGTQITVFTMGPMSAAQVIREAYAYGADNGYLISDKLFAGADVLATSYTLMQAISSVGAFDLIICGKQTTDGDTAQVGGAMAKWFHIPHITGVIKISGIKDNSMIVDYKINQQIITVEIDRPCLLAVERQAFIPRMPSLRLKMAGKKKEVPIIRIDKLEDQEGSHYGLSGSPTHVKAIYPPERTKKQAVKEMDGQTAALHIYNILTQVQDISQVEDIGEGL